MRTTYFKPGDHNAICFECGGKFKASELKKHWKGYYVCERDWEPREAQDFVKAIPDIVTPPWVQPPPAPIFINFCTPEGMTAISFYAVAGCVLAGYRSPAFDPNIFPNNVVELGV